MTSTSPARAVLIEPSPHASPIIPMEEALNEALLEVAATRNAGDDLAARYPETTCSKCLRVYDPAKKGKYFAGTIRTCLVCQKKGELHAEDVLGRKPRRVHTAAVSRLQREDRDGTPTPTLSEEMGAAAAQGYLDGASSGVTSRPPKRASAARVADLMHSMQHNNLNLYDPQLLVQPQPKKARGTPPPGAMQPQYGYGGGGYGGYDGMYGDSEMTDVVQVGFKRTSRDVALADNSRPRSSSGAGGKPSAGALQLERLKSAGVAQGSRSPLRTSDPDDNKHRNSYGTIWCAKHKAQVPATPSSRGALACAMCLDERRLARLSEEEKGAAATLMGFLADVEATASHATASPAGSDSEGDGAEGEVRHYSHRPSLDDVYHGGRGAGGAGGVGGQQDRGVMLKNGSVRGSPSRGSPAPDAPPPQQPQQLQPTRYDIAAAAGPPAGRAGSPAPAVLGARAQPVFAAKAHKTGLHRLSETSGAARPAVVPQPQPQQPQPRAQQSQPPHLAAEERLHMLSQLTQEVHRTQLQREREREQREREADLSRAPSGDGAQRFGIWAQQAAASALARASGGAAPGGSATAGTGNNHARKSPTRDENDYIPISTAITMNTAAGGSNLPTTVATAALAPPAVTTALSKLEAAVAAAAAAAAASRSPGLAYHPTGTAPAAAGLAAASSPRHCNNSSATAGDDFKAEGAASAAAADGVDRAATVSVLKEYRLALPLLNELPAYLERLLQYAGVLERDRANLRQVNAALQRHCGSQEAQMALLQQQLAQLQQQQQQQQEQAQQQHQQEAKDAPTV